MEFLDLVISHFDKSFNLEEFERIMLFEEGSSSFENFLVVNRVRVFQKLLVLFHFALKFRFFAGNEDTRLQYYEEDCDVDDSEKSEIHYGCSVVDNTYLGDWFFYYFVQSLSVSQVIIDYAYSPYDYKRFNSDGEIKFDKAGYCGKVFLNDFFVSDGLFVLESCLYAKPALASKIRSLFDEFESTFSDFVANNKDVSMVSHEVYTEWLLSWFPGMIHVRSLN